MNGSSELTRRIFANCDKCLVGDFDQSYRLSIKQSVGGKSILTHAHNSEDFTAILQRLCQDYPNLYQHNIRYYFYVDMGGFYHEINSQTWLRGTKGNFFDTYLAFH